MSAFLSAYLLKYLFTKRFAEKNNTFSEIKVCMDLTMKLFRSLIKYIGYG